jgi:hypothetical protein
MLIGTLPSANRTKEIVVAKVIEFDVSTKFHKPSKWAPDLHTRKVIEFALR